MSEMSLDLCLQGVKGRGEREKGINGGGGGGGGNEGRGGKGDVGGNMQLREGG